MTYWDSCPCQWAIWKVILWLRTRCEWRSICPSPQACSWIGQRDPPSLCLVGYFRFLLWTWSAWLAHSHLSSPLDHSFLPTTGWLLVSKQTTSLYPFLIFFWTGIILHGSVYKLYSFKIDSGFNGIKFPVTSGWTSVKMRCTDSAGWWPHRMAGLLNGNRQVGSKFRHRLDVPSLGFTPSCPYLMPGI
jgi:hypothetical protein